MRRIFIAGLVVLLTIGVSAAPAAMAQTPEKTHPLTVHDMLAMDRISDSRVSPDGKWIVFNVRETDLAANRGRTDIWLVGTDGKGLRRIDPNAAPISTALGVLGMPGLTAYFGLLEVCRPKRGEVVLVSGGAGAVGSVVGQIAKMRGCHVIGIAGADAKINHMVRDYGYDAAFNYKSVENYYAVLSEMCPDGVDIYFDNVGGAVTDAALRLLTTGARVAICGQISDYNLEQPESGPRPFPLLLFKQARAEGFLVMQFADRYPEALAQLTRWLQDKKLKYREDIVEGIENAPAAFIAMLHGRNIGKQLVKLAVP